MNVGHNPWLDPTLVAVCAAVSVWQAWRARAGRRTAGGCAWLRMLDAIRVGAFKLSEFPVG